MKEKTKNSKGVLITKISVFGVLALVGIFGFSFAPKPVFPDGTAYSMAAGMALRDDEDLVFLEYKVYASEERFAIGLDKDVATHKASFVSRNEIMVIKIHGEKGSSFASDYWTLSSPETPELNIEYYIAQNLSVSGTSISCRTAIMALDDLFRAVNAIYLWSLVGVFAIVEGICAVHLLRNSCALKALESTRKDSVVSEVK